MDPKQERPKPQSPVEGNVRAFDEPVAREQLEGEKAKRDPSVQDALRKQPMPEKP